MKISKQLYNFTQSVFQKNRQGGIIKNGSLANKLHNEFGFGQFDITKEQLTFTLTDIIELSKEVQSLLKVDIRNDPYPTKTDRVQTAENNRNEKENSYSVSHDFILVNSLTKLKINRTENNITPLTSLGIYLKADDIQSIEHSAIVLVENLAVMANLDAINIPSLDTTIDLTNALWLYRGDIKAQQTTNTSYQFFRRFSGKLPLVCFSDLDPKGIEIALTSNATYWLTLNNLDNLTIALSGQEQEWYQQSAARMFLENKVDKFENNESIPPWVDYFKLLQHERKTLKQEHMLQHKLALCLIAIQ